MTFQGSGVFPESMLVVITKCLPVCTRDKYSHPLFHSPEPGLCVFQVVCLDGIWLGLTFCVCLCSSGLEKVSKSFISLELLNHGTTS